MAWTHLKLRQFDEAIPRFRKVLARNPKSESALEGLGRGLYAKGDYKAAAGRFKRALEINAKNREAKTWLGFAYFREGKFSEAEKLLGGFGRIGVEIKKQGEGLLVVRVLEGSPAAKAGLIGGDEVRAINGETVQDIPTFIPQDWGGGNRGPGRSPYPEGRDDNRHQRDAGEGSQTGAPGV